MAIRISTLAYLTFVSFVIIFCGYELSKAICDGKTAEMFAMFSCILLQLLNFPVADRELRQNDAHIRAALALETNQRR